MSISQNFPDEGPSLNLNFASSRRLDPRITFTRTSTGTYTDKNGLVTIAPTDTPRFDHSYDGSNVQSLGLLIEESRTNLITYSGIPSANWLVNLSPTVTSNSAISPDGTTNATQIAAPATFAAGIYQLLSLNSGTVYTYSLFVKAVSGSNTIYFGSDTGTEANLEVNTSTGATTIRTGSLTNITSTPYPNGWYRIAFTFTASATANHSFIIYNRTASANTWLAWGAQVEAGAFPTSYIPTVASTVTRSADNASMTGTNFTSWYNSSEWTLVTRTSVPSSNLIASPAAVQYSSIDDGTTNNWYTIRYVTDTSSPYIDGYANASGVPTFDFTGSSTYTFPNPVKSALAVKLNDAAFCYNGNTVETDSSVTLSTSVNRLVIGGAPKAGTISQLLYYPKRLTNSQLQNLTK